MKTSLQLRHHRLLVCVTCSLLLSSGIPARAELEPQTPWFDGLGRHSRPITTDHDGAQGYFDQGLAFLMAANPDEAIRSFEEALRFDPRCAMAYWGLAIAHGPQLELPPPSPERILAAVAAVNRAHELAQQKARPDEQALIAALARRYADPPPADRRPLDRAYAAAMREVWQAYPNDPDIATWYAAALVLAAGEPLWTADGQPADVTNEIVRAAQSALQLDVRHPLANRLMILVHASSPHPERAEASVAVLRGLAPGLGHLLHLPARIDARLGRWAEALQSTQKALTADARYLELSGRPADRYHLVIGVHHLTGIHAAVLSGRRARAVELAGQLVDALPATWLASRPDVADRVQSLPLQVLVRFGLYDEVLTAPDFSPSLALSRSLRHAVRGLALVQRGDAARARAELDALVAAVGGVAENPPPWGNPSQALVAVAAHLLTADILLREADAVGALAAYQRAVDAADQLQDAQAPLWMLEPRHALGAALLQLRQPMEAERVFSDHLSRWPGNGWALAGLLQSLQLQERLKEAAEVEAQLAALAQSADALIDGPWLPAPAPQAVAVASRR